MIGTLAKMRTQLDDDGLAHYQLIAGEHHLAMNGFLNKPLTLNFTGNIYCQNCSKKTKKSYSQGFCYLCMKKLASCDLCIMKPETCHFAEGTCREPEWGEANCNIPHYVYLSNTSGVKVGITRHTQIPTRWIDQGATQAMIIAKVSSRHISGLLEVAIAKHVADKTHWQAMLKGHAENKDLASIASTLLAEVTDTVDSLRATYGDDAVTLVNEPVRQIDYPIDTFPTKVKSFNFDKQPEVQGVLLGIKGQYLIFDTGVINIRKYGGYEVSVSQ